MKLFYKRLYKHKELVFLLLLLFLTVFLRFTQLGYSHYYGDETKALYLRKDTGAADFLLNQRKGPVQFLVAWTMEKITGGYLESTTRFPFAVAGTISVFLLYFLVKKLFGIRAAMFSSLLFCLNGFFVAFSRTVQYQSFLWFFGLLAVFLGLFIIDEKSARKRAVMLVTLGLLLGAAFLSHWDAIFYAVPIGLLLIFGLNHENANESLNLRFGENINPKESLYFILPLFLVVALFYVPYITRGYYVENFHSYVQKRASGEGQLPSSSLATFDFYNPYFIGFALLAFSIFALLGLYGKKRIGFYEFMLLVWFIVPFVVFELVFSNPGTHIQNYIIPLLMLAGVGFSKLSRFLEEKNKILSRMYVVAIFCLFLFYAFVQSTVYVPGLNNGYPWNSKVRIKDKYQLFLYGFPYNRGWYQVREYAEEDTVRSFYTNDNVTVGTYYLFGIPAMHLQAPSQIPDTFIYVFNNQEGKHLSEQELLEIYNLEKELFVDGVLVSKIYKIK